MGMRRGDTQISARIVADSVSPDGDRLTTFECEYPRFIHSEVMTHRVFSRNAASSRAIPVERMLRRYYQDPALPVRWGVEQPGMQSGGELEGRDLLDALNLWGRVHEDTWLAVENYLKTHEKGKRLHKSLVNRLLEPYAWMRTVVTGTNWAGFYALRAANLTPHAQPEFGVLADQMLAAWNQSVPNVVGERGWHLPYVDVEDTETVAGLTTLQEAKYLSVARCAWVSVDKPGENGKRDNREAVEFARVKLGQQTPPHASPFEHVATPCRCEKFLAYAPKTGRVDVNRSFRPDHRGNFAGWDQFRHELGMG